MSTSSKIKEGDIFYIKNNNKLGINIEGTILCIRKNKYLYMFRQLKMKIEYLTPTNSFTATDEEFFDDERKLFDIKYLGNKNTLPEYFL